MKRVIKSGNTSKINVDNSIFIGEVFYVLSVDQVSTILLELKRKYKDATHVTHASIISDLNFISFSDDFEPSGTAGKVILNQLYSYQLDNILLVVIRYFGRRKLGVRGLIDAYKEAAVTTIESNKITVISLLNEYKIIVKDIAHFNLIEGLLNKNNSLIISRLFDPQIELIVACNNLDCLNQYSNLITVEFLKKDYY